MDRERLNEALTSLTRRELAALRNHVDRVLRECAICGNEGAEHVTAKRGDARGSLLLCLPCWERVRDLPRAAEG